MKQCVLSDTPNVEPVHIEHRLNGEKFLNSGSDEEFRDGTVFWEKRIHHWLCVLFFGFCRWTNTTANTKNMFKQK